MYMDAARAVSTGCVGAERLRFLCDDDDDDDDDDVSRGRRLAAR